MRRKYNEDLSGQKFFRWTALSKADLPHNFGSAYWVCRCECGTERPVLRGSLTKGLSKGCGLGKCRTSFKHGHSLGAGESREYGIWSGMKQRCNNPASPNYHRYGGRGITHCDRWHDFAEFLKDMGDAPEGMSLERIDNDKGYSHENCKWATSKEQSRNTVITTKINIGDSEFSLSALAEAIGKDRKRVAEKVKKGWAFEILFKPPPKQ